MSDAERMIFLCLFKSIPWQIIESLQICYDHGDEVVKDAALTAAKKIELLISNLKRLQTNS